MENNHGAKKAHASKEAKAEFKALCKRIAQINPSDQKLIAFITAFCLSNNGVKEGTFTESYKLMAGLNTDNPYVFTATHNYSKADDGTVRLIYADVRCIKKTNVIEPKRIKYGNIDQVVAFKIDASTREFTPITIATSNEAIAKALGADAVGDFESKNLKVFYDDEAMPRNKGFKLNGVQMFKDAIVCKLEDGELQSISEEELKTQIS